MLVKVIYMHGGIVVSQEYSFLCDFGFQCSTLSITVFLSRLRSLNIENNKNKGVYESCTLPTEL